MVSGLFRLKDEQCASLLSKLVGIGDACKLIEACGGAGRLARIGIRCVEDCIKKYNRKKSEKDKLYICNSTIELMYSMFEFFRIAYWDCEDGLSKTISCCGDAYGWFRRELTFGAKREWFWVLPLDSDNKPICRPVAIARGLLNGVPAAPREVFAEAIKVNASAVIVAHNHPSGDCGPSKKDIAITKELLDASRILRIPLLDHIVISDIECISIRDAGYVKFDDEKKTKKGKKNASKKN